MNSIAEDYYALRTEGIGLLQKLSGQNWTDYNTHDPGITILEQLCYALTDLAYRIGHPIPDLLADPGEIFFAPELYRVRGILTSGPVTPEDYRKILLDIDGVRNAWIEKTDLPEPLISATDTELRLVKIGEVDMTTNKPVQGKPVKGMLKVKIEPGNSAVDSADTQNLFENVMLKIMDSRNLGEDFIQLEVLQPEYVRIDAELEVEEVIDPSELLIEIYSVLNRFISPDPVFYSLKEMLEKGYSVDQFMDGPPLEKGYLDPEEFKNFTKREFLRGSDLIHVLSEIQGVRYVRQLQIVLLKDKDKGEVTQSDSWSVTLNPGRFPQLLIPDGADFLIKLKRGEFTLNTPEFQSRWILRVNEKQTSISAEQDLDIVPKPGRYRFPGIYQSIQNDFPLIYGIEEGGLTNDASPQLKARVKQLKAYLLFFDQILANAFAQLEGFRTFISYDNNKNLSVFSQLPEDVPALDSLLIPPGREKLNKFYLSQNKLTDNTNENISLHRVADHLLARMGEQISDYSLLGKTGEGENQFLDLKKKLLERYVELSQTRLAGVNYTLQANGNKNRFPALQKRISLLLGISGGNQTDERFYLLEHQLLRPLKADFEQYSQKPIQKNNTDAVSRYYIHQPARADIFSLQISYVFPGWIDRFKNETFRSFAERLIRTETPAHIKTYVYWMDEVQFDLFEQTFQDWQNQMSMYGYPLSIDHREMEENALLRLRLTRNRLIDCLTTSDKVFGYSYPVLDLPVEIKDGGRILEGERAEVKIKFSQKGVSYRLWNKELGLNGNAVDGTGEEEAIILRTNVLRNDSRISKEPVINFDILAGKFTGMPETKLQQIVSVTIQLLQWDLKVDIVKGGKIIEGGEIDFNSEISVRIYEPQSGVIYTLYSLLLKDSYFDCPPIGENRGYSVNKDIINDDKLYIIRQDLTAATPEGGSGFLDIKVPTGKITGDTILKVGTSFGGENPLIEFLDARPGVFIRPDPGVSITMLKNDKTRAQIASPEAGVLYTLFNKDKPVSSCAWLPQKGLVADEENANIRNMRYELDFVLDALNNELKPPLIFNLPEITEGTTFPVKAQKLNTKLEVFLNKGLQAELNKTDLDLKVEISKDGKIDFNSEFSLRILKPQKGINYTVYSALLADGDFEYSFDNDSRVLNINQGRVQKNDNLFIPAEELNAGTNEAGIEFLDIKVPAGKLTGDSIIKLGVSFAGKKPVTEFLDARVFVFIGPDPNVKISAIETEPRQILIDSPEAGVLYTLLMEGTPFSGSAWLPAKSLTVEGKDANKNMRVEVDFVPDATKEKPLRFLLPVISNKTTFSLKALKLNTRMEAPLNTTLEILKTKINIKNNG
jgi:hypothetical protein